jgi:hypothetical protein
MKCDSRASLLAHTFASPCLGHKPKARVVTLPFEVHTNVNDYTINGVFMQDEHLIVFLNKKLCRTLLNVELIHKLGQINVVSNALNRKEEFQVEKPLTKTQTLRAIIQGEN